MCFQNFVVINKIHPLKKHKKKHERCSLDGVCERNDGTICSADDVNLLLKM